MLAPITLVGVLTEQGHRGCKNGEETWINPHFEVGFHPITLAEHLSPPSPDWIGKPVVVVGEVAPSPRFAPIEDDGTCPPMQARSDWVPSKGGIRLQRDDVPEPKHMRVTSLLPFEGLKAKVEGDKLLISFENTLGIALTGIELRVHYEGCYGKPGTALQTRKLGDLAIGAKAAAEAPARIIRQEARGNEHVLWSIQVVGAGAVFDLDASMRGLVECTERKPQRKIQLEP